jgi:hypothetical protein
MGMIQRLTSASALALLVGTAAESASAQSAAYLDQGWSASDRQYFYRTTQGSRLMSYRVFVKLETASSTVRFASEQNLGAYGYLFDYDAQSNPDNLPIGFVKDDPLTKSAAVGLTCSACHTRDLTVKNQYGAALRYRIDGGQAYTDTERFLRELEQALVATTNDSVKLARLYAAVGVSTTSDKAAVLGEVNSAIAKLKEERLANMPAGQSVNDPGPGRLDALAHIKNRVANYVYPQNYAQPGNNIDATAPVNFPFLWDAAYQDFTQWPGTVANSGIGPYVRNLGEVTGVFAETNVSRTLGLYTAASSANVTNLNKLENKLLTLKSPLWPADRAPLDPALVARGDGLFKTHCASCHVELDRAPRTKYVQTFAFGAEFMGTDRTQADNNLNDIALAGLTAGEIGSVASKRLVAPNSILALTLVAPIAYATPTVLALQGDHKQSGASSAPLGGITGNDKPGQTYKARPLNGIWATAPYLHNGSVRTLYDLMLPASSRPKSFCAGSIELDTRDVGLVNDCSVPNVYRFDATKRGNYNTGHEFGTGFNEYDKRAVVEYMKTL